MDHQPGASLTITFRLLVATAPKSAGAMLRMLVPSIQLLVQNSVDSPNPTVDIVAALNSASNLLSFFSGSAAPDGP